MHYDGRIQAVLMGYFFSKETTSKLLVCNMECRQKTKELPVCLCTVMSNAETPEFNCNIVPTKRNKRGELNNYEVARRQSLINAF